MLPLGFQNTLRVQQGLLHHYDASMVWYISGRHWHGIRHRVTASHPTCKWYNCISHWKHWVLCTAWQTKTASLQRVP